MKSEQVTYSGCNWKNCFKAGGGRNGKRMGHLGVFRALGGKQRVAVPAWVWILRLQSTIWEKQKVRKIKLIQRTEA